MDHSQSKSFVGNADGSVRCSMEVLSVRLFCLLECLGYGLVVPFLAYRFALWFRIMKT